MGKQYTLLSGAHNKQAPAYQTAKRESPVRGTHTQAHNKQAPAYQTAKRWIAGHGQMRTCTSTQLKTGYTCTHNSAHTCSADSKSLFRVCQCNGVDVFTGTGETSQDRGVSSTGGIDMDWGVSGTGGIAQDWGVSGAGDIEMFLGE